MLDHGGRLNKAARRYNIPPEHWLDLSTGINPNGWPVPAIPAEHWARLPQEDDGLLAAAKDYYGCEHLLPVAGSQAAIQLLPSLFDAPGPVGIIDPGYEEHRQAWQRAGHNIIPLAPEHIGRDISGLGVLVLIHPNNPTGTVFKKNQLLEWHEDLAARGGTLIVDEAFMDATPEHSLLPFAGQKGLIILRSMGKFFGLAGARLGFVCAAPQTLSPLRERLGPWALNGPARFIARKALDDKDWQQSTRRQLIADGQRLATLLTRHQLAPADGCNLFAWTITQRAEKLHEALARQGILTRLFDRPRSLRFGLPGDEQQWQRLDETLQKITTSQIMHR